MLFWLPISFSPSQNQSLMSFVFWQVTSSHGTLKNIQRTLGANLSGFLVLHIFEHISIGHLVVWLDWMSLSECDHHWTQLNALERTLSACECLWVSNERAWIHSECTWMPLSEHWTRLNMHECTQMPLSESEHDWTHFFTDSYMKMSAHECLWVSGNEIEHVWMRFEYVWKPLSMYWIQLNEIECTWMPLSEYWTYVSAHL